MILEYEDLEGSEDIVVWLDYENSIIVKKEKFNNFLLDNDYVGNFIDQYWSDHYQDMQDVKVTVTMEDLDMKQMRKYLDEYVKTINKAA